MMILKRKEIIAAALVVMIGVAGYLNWSYQDTIRVTDGETYSETGKKLGEAQYVSTTKNDEDADKDETEKKEDKKEDKKTKKAEKSDDQAKSTSADYFTEARLEKESSRSKSLEILNQTAANESFDADIRQKAQNQILKMAEDVEKESMIEKVAQAKGYQEVAVYIDGDSVKLIVKKDSLNEQDVAKLKDIIVEQTGISPQNIKIVEMK